jgi:hypothetical protein
MCHESSSSFNRTAPLHTGPVIQFAIWTGNTSIPSTWPIWPPNSPDLNPMDWGVVQQSVLQSRVHNVTEATFAGRLARYEAGRYWQCNWRVEPPSSSFCVGQTGMFRAKDVKTSITCWIATFQHESNLNCARLSNIKILDMWQLWIFFQMSWSRHVMRILSQNRFPFISERMLKIGRDLTKLLPKFGSTLIFWDTYSVYVVTALTTYIQHTCMVSLVLSGDRIYGQKWILEA